MPDDHEEPGSRAPHDQTCGLIVKRRAVCVWLGGLASHRQGLVKRLVRSHGSVAEIIDCSPERLTAELAASAAYGRRTAHTPGPLTRDAGAGATESEPDGGAAVSDDANEARTFHSILGIPPQRYLEWAESRGTGHAVVAWSDPLYPPALRQLADPPLCLFLRHRCSTEDLVRRLETLCAQPAVAVVGTRGPSIYGEEMATLLGRDLTTCGILVVSGLAMGIDALAQAAAINATREKRTPTTVAVLGCGADVVYPQTNRRLYFQIASSGLVLSEFAWNVPARPWRFPARNRVMAGLTRAVVVVEGAERSGARLTADFALELGREVLAVPGEAGKKLTSAPHRLLRQGAALCESADDVLAAITPLGGEPYRAASPAAKQVDGLQQALDNGSGVVTHVLQSLLAGPMSTDQVSRRCAIPIHTASAALSELEVDGLVHLLSGGVYRLRRG
ncbi:MAG TPA: DNA-processing protein DprA [Thermoleophilia bacterium]|nr:DNA-processing protein DprA [Thermoleophilia bacterium]